MAKAGVPSVDDYIAKQPDEARKVLRRVRALIRKAVPGAEETISYQIPTYRLDGTYVVYFAGWKEHYSLYPVPGAVRAALGAQLDRYEMSKGTIRFPYADPVPARLIARIAALLAKEARGRGGAKRPRAKGGVR